MTLVLSHVSSEAQNVGVGTHGQAHNLFLRPSE
jgi:hypothetical protein